MDVSRESKRPGDVVTRNGMVPALYAADQGGRVRAGEAAVRIELTGPAIVVAEYDREGERRPARPPGAERLEKARRHRGARVGEIPQRYDMLSRDRLDQFGEAP
jgi:hypothetical protein